ncbi:hypothetical protein GCM10010392_62960 [Streptomyces clavifer]|nr:hypothetical protein GCM10010392_62960 [Streptomyces clavifer]
MRFSWRNCVIARRGTPHGSGLGKTRWVVERTFACLHQFKRLRIRYEIRDLRLELLRFARSIICLRRLRTSFRSDQSAQRTDAVALRNMPRPGRRSVRPDLESGPTTDCRRIRRSGHLRGGHKQQGCDATARQ